MTDFLTEIESKGINIVHLNELNPQWKPWPEDCPECGGSLEVLSQDTRPGWAYDGDPVRCTDVENCGASGHISCSAEDDCYAMFPE